MDNPDSSTPLSPILNWPGGKTKLIKKLLKEIPDHTVYVEPFVGGGSLFFAKPLAEKNVINDKHAGLINFYKSVRDKDCKYLQSCEVPKTQEQYAHKKSIMNKNACAFLGVNKLAVD